MTKNHIDPKTTALLALEAKMIEKRSEVYNLESYIPEMFFQIEKVLSTKQPERLLDSVELKTFQTLIYTHTGGERRKERDRRKTTKGAYDEDRRNVDRRWYGETPSQSEIQQ